MVQRKVRELTFSISSLMQRYLSSTVLCPISLLVPAQVYCLCTPKRLVELMVSYFGKQVSFVLSKQVCAFQWETLTEAKISLFKTVSSFLSYLVPAFPSCWFYLKTQFNQYLLNSLVFSQEGINSQANFVLFCIFNRL